MDIDKDIIIKITKNYLSIKIQMLSTQYLHNKIKPRLSLVDKYII